MSALVTRRFLVNRAPFFLCCEGIVMLFLLLLFACGEEANDTASEDTAVESTEQMGANFFCG